jgi:ATP-dependent Clp protease ATP-binding subunit ClpB
VDFKNTVLIMTSNLGSREILEAFEREEEESAVREEVLEVLRGHFKPEFLNRVDDIVIFHQLSRKQIGGIIELQLERLRRMLADRQITLTLDDSAKQVLAREGYDPLYGARPLKRAIQTLVQNPLASRLLRGEILPGTTVRVSADGDGLSFTTEANAAEAAGAK